MAFRPASMYWCRWMRHRSRATCGLCKNSTGGHMRKLILAAASIAAFALAAPASAQAPIVLKFSHVPAPDTPKDKAAEKLKELGEKHTTGKVKIDVYPISSLYHDQQ